MSEEALSAAARRRQKILQAGADRMKVVSGFEVKDTREELSEYSTPQATPNPDKVRNRRLQARKIPDLAPGTATSVIGGAPSDEIVKEDQERKMEEKCLAPPAMENLDSRPDVALLSSTSSSSIATTTGGNVLRRRFHSRTSSNNQEGLSSSSSLDKSSSSKAFTSFKAPPIMSKIDSAALHDLICLLVIGVFGAVMGIWAVRENFQQILETTGRGGQQQEELSSTRAALEAFIDRERFQERESAALLGEVVGASGFPLPVLAFLLQLLLLGLVRLLGSSSSPLPAAESMGGGGEQDQKNNTAPAKPGSLMETIAHSAGLQPVLEAMRFGQTLWQSVLIFLFFFISTLAIATKILA